MSNHRPASPVRLRELVAQVSRRWIVLIVSIALVTAASLAASTLVRKEYTAAASLAVSPLTTNPFSAAAVNQQININTERAILESPEVARLAAEALGTGAAAPGALLQQVDVAAPSGSQILEVRVTMPHPQEAADYANAMAAAYLQFRAEGAADLAAGYIAALDEAIASLSAVGNPTEQQAQRLADAVQQRQTLTLVADSPGRIIGVASAPSKPSSLSRLSFLMAGLIGGVLVGIVAALVRERLDRKIRTRSRLSEACSVPALKVTGTNDAEGMRWVLRSLTAASSAQAGGPLLISTMPAFSRSSYPQEFTDGLADVARAAGFSVLVVRPADIDPAKIDRGWPGSAANRWHHLDLVILEIDQHLSGARLARLADHLDAVVVLAYAASSMKDLRRLQSDLAGSSAQRVPVLLENRSNEELSKERDPGALLTLHTPAIAEQETVKRREFA